MRKGFTLIELLVVIGVFGIMLSFFLVSASGARTSGRDSRRIADLRAVEQGLHLYLIKCGMFPGRYDATNGCVGGLTTSLNADKGPTDWNVLALTLTSSPIGFGEVPFDPSPGRSYHYWVQLGDAINTPRAQCYVLKADLETDHRALQNDLENADLISKLTPRTCNQIGCKNLWPSAPLDCDDASGNNYCVGNIECFKGL